MSKPKGRRKPLHSEITSLLRSTEEAEAAPASAAEVVPADDRAEHAGPGTDDAAPSLTRDDAGPAEVEEVPAVADAEPADEVAPEEDVLALEDVVGLQEDEEPTVVVESFGEASAAALADREASNVVSIDGDEPDDMEVFLSGLIEALLFTSQRPLALKEIARAAGIDRPRARELVDRLIRSYSPRGINIDEVAGGYVLRSSARYAPQIQKFLSLRPVRLSRAQLETLAIVAYRQPVTKPEVDDIRGVDSGQVLKGLMERNLLKIVGKKDEPGRPMLYGTTNDFLELLNLSSLGQLPTLREYTELSEESRQKFADEIGEDAPLDLPLDAPLESATSAEAGGIDSASAAGVESAAELASDAETAAQTSDAVSEAVASDLLEPEAPEADAEAVAQTVAAESESEPLPDETAQAGQADEDEESKDEDDDDLDEDEDDDEDDDDLDEDDEDAPSGEEDDEDDEDDEDEDEDDEDE